MVTPQQMLQEAIDEVNSLSVDELGKMLQEAGFDCVPRSFIDVIIPNTHGLGNLGRFIDFDIDDKYIKVYILYRSKSGVVSFGRNIDEIRQHQIANGNYEYCSEHFICDDNGLYKCAHCNRTFTNFLTFAQHLLKEHPEYKKDLYTELFVKLDPHFYEDIIEHD